MKFSHVNKKKKRDIQAVRILLFFIKAVKPDYLQEICKAYRSVPASHCTALLAVCSTQLTTKQTRLNLFCGMGKKWWQGSKILTFE